MLLALLPVAAIDLARAQPAPAASLHLERGIRHSHEGRFAEAAAEFIAAIRAEPKLPEAHYLLGLVRQSWGKWADARDSYRTALRLQPRYPEAQLGLAAVLARLADDEASRSVASAACRKAIELNPKEAEPHFHLGLIHKQNGDFEAAAGELEAVLRLAPRYPGAPLALADVLVELRRFDRAVPILKTLIAAQPDLAFAHHLLGAAFAKQDDSALAVQHLTRAAHLDEKNAQTRYILAINLRKLGRTAEAAAEMERFRELTAGRESVMQARYHLGLAQKLLGGGKVEAAILEYQLSLSHRRDGATAVDLGVALLKAGHVEEAIEVLRDAAREPGPHQALAQYHLGLAQARKQDYPQARTAFSEALRLRPGFPEALFGLGMAFAMDGQAAQAEEHLRASILLRPDLAASHHYLGIVLKERGRLAEAEAEFQTAQRLDPAGSYLLQPRR
jgi:Flp pilus assembly protein TadD